MTALQLRFSHFFNASPGDTDVESRLKSLPGFPASCSRGAVLCGPERSGRSSLLLNVARNLALESPGSRVIFLCRRDKMEASSPVFQAGSGGPRDPAFSAVHFKFVESCADLIRFASCIHLVVNNDEPIAGILVDDLSELIAGASPQRLATVLAFLTDAARQVGGRRSDEAPIKQSCPLIVTDLSTAEGGPSNLFVYRKWLPLALVIRSTSGSSFSLSALAPTNKEPRTLPPDLHHADLCFSISQSSLHLDAIRSCPACTNEAPGFP